MKFISFQQVLIAFLFCFFSCQNHQKSSDELKDHINTEHPYYEIADSIVQLMKSEADLLKCPGFAVTIVADSSILKKEGYGIANKSTGSRIDNSTVFRIASLSKSFATLTAKILEQENHFKFSDRVTDLVPGLLFHNKKMNDSMTIRHILSMSTGLPMHSYTNLIENNESLDNIIPLFKNVKPIYPLGHNCTYQNASFGLIEKIIFNTTGSLYTQHLKEKIFQPLKMKSSFDCDNFLDAKNIAWPHRVTYHGNDSSYVIDNFNQKYYNLVSAGGINASINDLTHYLLFLINGDENILPDRKRLELFSEQVEVLPEKRSYESWPHIASIHYGYGWRIVHLNNGSKWIFHGGYVNRYQSLIVFNLEKKLGMSFMFNSDCPIGGEIMKWFIGAVEGLKDEPYEMIE